MFQALYARLIDPARPITRAALIIAWAIILNAVFLLLPNFIRGGDAAFHIFNTQQFAAGLREGVLYPRWFGDFFNGYGAPVGVGYAPLTYYAGSAFMLVGFSVFTALKLLLTITLVIGGLGMQRLASRFLPIPGALAAALVYQAMPYYVIDLYSRAALGEYISFAWLPFIFLFAYQCIKKQRLLDHVLLAFTLGGLVLTHILTAYMAAFGVAIFVIVLIAQEPRGWLWKLVRLGLAGGLGLGLAAIYVLPLLSETSYLDTNHLTETTFGNYQNNFLFNAWGYLGTERTATFLENTMIGVGALLSIVLVITMAVTLYRNWRGYAPGRRPIALAMICVFGFSMFMSFSLSSPLWAILPRASMLQFPTRWQTLSALSGAYVAGEIITWLLETRGNRQQLPTRQRRMLPLFIALVIIGHVIYSAGLVGALAYLRRGIRSDLAAQLSGAAPVTSDNFGRVFPSEYKPQWVATLDTAKSSQVDPAQGIIVSDAAAQVDMQSWQLSRRVFTVNTPSAATVDLQTFWFPGWQAIINGQSVETQARSGDGTIEFPISAGTSEVVVQFENTPVRTTGSIISMISWIVLGVLFVYSMIRRNSIQT
ncbi:MAG: 6-pyruvoyl-tetrahydropterin synthase-related protein [Chloroflexota bacterium]